MHQVPPSSLIWKPHGFFAEQRSTSKDIKVHSLHKLFPHAVICRPEMSCSLIFAKNPKQINELLGVDKVIQCIYSPEQILDFIRMLKRAAAQLVSMRNIISTIHVVKEPILYPGQRTFLRKSSAQKSFIEPFTSSAPFNIASLFWKAHKHAVRDVNTNCWVHRVAELEWFATYYFTSLTYLCLFLWQKARIETWGPSKGETAVWD